MKNRPIYLFLGTALGLYAAPANAEVGCRDMVDKLHKVIKQSAYYQDWTYDDVVGSWPSFCAQLSQWGGTYVVDCNENGDTYAAVANCGKYASASTACQNTICGYSDGGDEGGSGCGVYTAMNGEYYEQSADTCYVPSTEYFFTSQGHKYHFKSNCWWSS